MLQIAEEFFGITLNVQVLCEEGAGAKNTQHKLIRYRLDFDNRRFEEARALRRSHHELKLQAVPCSFLMKLFPFGLVIGKF